MSALETYAPLVQLVLFFAGWSSAMLTGLLIERVK